MVRAVLTAVTTLFLVSACGPNTPAETTPPVATDAAVPDGVEPAATLLVLGEAKLFERDEPDNAFTIGADGTLTLEGETVGTVSTDGALKTADGTVVMQAQADGSVLVRGESSGLSLSDTGGSLTMDDRTVTVSFDAEGLVNIDPPPSNEGLLMGHEGCDGEMAKTCMLVMFGLTMGESVESEGPTPTQ
jgi:hypothetical protein